MSAVRYVLLAILASGMGACASDSLADPDEGAPDAGGEGGGDPYGEGSGNDELPPQDPPPPDPDAPSDPGSPPVAPSVTCSYGADVYTPYPGTATYPLGPVASHPWRGPTTPYPDGIESFTGYGTALPATVECGSNKALRKHLDVTAGCLAAIPSGGNAVGQIQQTSSGIFRAFAHGFAPGEATRPVKWSDQGIEYRFRYATPATGNTGFKAFTRYTTEYDLYVASWRMDGVVQIQKKQCGAYTILKKTTSIAPPSPNTWHTIRFEAEGTQLRLYLDGALAMSVVDTTFTTGTAGIRIDAMRDALIDDWRVFAP